MRSINKLDVHHLEYKFAELDHANISKFMALLYVYYVATFSICSLVGMVYIMSAQPPNITAPNVPKASSCLLRPAITVLFTLHEIVAPPTSLSLFCLQILTLPNGYQTVKSCQSILFYTKHNNLLLQKQKHNIQL